MPKPMWGNRAPPVPSQPADDPPPLPPGMPKPMWGNRAPPKPAADDPPPLPPGMPKPMWSQKAPSAPSAPVAEEDRGSLSRISNQADASSVTLTASGCSETTASGGSAGSSASPARLGAVDMGGSGVVGAKHIDHIERQSTFDGSGKAEKPKKVVPGTEFQYVLEEKLGAGAYAKVKKAVTVETGEVFAVKIFKVSLLKRRRMWDSQVSGFKTAFDDVIREIAIMRRLRHDNVMNMYDVIDDVNANKLYMIMDFCEKGAIMQTENMPYEKGIDMASCLRWFADSAVGLEYLHFQGVVHYDLKPDNILIGHDDRAIIADFGVSRMNPNKSDTTIGSPGTPTYTAPEVWGSGSYHGKLADVWALGVTLHAMVFGCLPYAAASQVDLIAAVTDPAEWSCAFSHDDKPMMEVLYGMMAKDPAKRFSLAKVNESKWLRDEVTKRKEGVEWSKIEINDADLKNAVTHGHVNNFKRTQHGTLLKLTDEQEMIMYNLLHGSTTSPFLPKLISHRPAMGKKRVVMELEDLTFGLKEPCLMDCKMGTRTYAELTSSSDLLPRKDLLEKLQKVSADAASEEEKAAGGVTKERYLRFRDEASSTRTLGFRVDAVQLNEGSDHSDIPTLHELRLLATREQVRETLAKYLQRRRVLLTSFLGQLRELRTTLESCSVFKQHSFIRSSILFVYDGATNTTLLRMIDLARVQLLTARDSAAEGGGDEAAAEAPQLSHRAEWVPGNNEDGFLTGLDNMIDIFEGLLADESV